MRFEDSLLRKEKRIVKTMISQSVSCQFYQKYLKDGCLGKYQTIWTITYRDISADLEKIIAHKIVFCTCLANRKGR